MRIVKNIIYGLVALAFTAFASCSNEYPEFNDNDAFIAFTQSTMSVSEVDGELEIPVLLTSLSGKEGSIDFEIVADKISPAIEGVNYTLENASKTLTFTKDENTQVIKLKIIDNDTYDGDVRFSIKLTNAQGVNLGADNSISVTIEDDEHPLAFMFGVYNATGESYFNGPTEWNLRISKDDDDVSKVWILNLVPGGTSEAVYGTVNDDITEMRIPVKQEIVISSSYAAVYLDAFYGEDGDEDVDDYIVAHITTGEDGSVTISIPDYWFGSQVYDDAGIEDGWFNIIKSGAVFKLN